jgi:hypothetical protein
MLDLTGIPVDAQGHHWARQNAALTRPANGDQFASATGSKLVCAAEEPGRRLGVIALFLGYLGSPNYLVTCSLAGILVVCTDGLHNDSRQGVCGQEHRGKFPRPRTRGRFAVTCSDFKLPLTASKTLAPIWHRGPPVAVHGRCQPDTHLTRGLPYEPGSVSAAAADAQVRAGYSMTGPTSATMHRSSRRCSSVGRAAVL